MNAPVKFVGYPDGEKVFIAELGKEVGVFTQEVKTPFGCLKHHVPLNQRGPFRPQELANYDPNKEYRTNNYGYLLCYQKTAKNELCKGKAVNRWPRCGSHGGAVHPFDHIIREDKEPEDVATQTRYRQYLAGALPVEDLDDDEIMAFGFKDPKGRIFKPKNISREMVQAFTKVIFDRSLDKMKGSALSAANTLAMLMEDPTVDANIRVKCATEILDRTLGKAPQLVSVTTDAPWEQVFEAIASVDREKSRASRDILDVETVPEIEAPKTTVTLRNSGFE